MKPILNIATLRFIYLFIFLHNNVRTCSIEPIFFKFSPKKAPFVPSFMKIYPPKNNLEKTTLNQPDVKLLSSLFNKINNNKKGQIEQQLLSCTNGSANLLFGKFTSNPKSLTLTLTPSYTLVGEP